MERLEKLLHAPTTQGVAIVLSEMFSRGGEEGRDACDLLGRHFVTLGGGLQYGALNFVSDWWVNRQADL